MRVFVSATREDLEPDCRPAVLLAIKIGDAQAETMEFWDVEYNQTPVDLCREKLEKNATHYIGIFAHRYGWKPPGFTISITEAEFEWAWNSKPRKRMAVFIPKPGTPLDKTLVERAANETDIEKVAQAAFRRRVQNLGGTVALFENTDELSSRVSHRVTLWSMGGLMEFSRGAAGPHGAPPPVHLLGRSRHESGFKLAWEVLANLSLPSVAGFLLHGPPAAGQVELIERFVSEMETETGDLRRIVIRIGASWERRDLAMLLERLGHQLQPGWRPQNPAEVAARLATILADSEVVLEIHDLHRFPRGAAGLIEEFWQPLRNSFAPAPRHRCTVFLVMDGKPDDACKPLLFDPLSGDPDEFLPAQVFGLPELGKFTVGEVKLWLQKLPVVPHDPAATAQALVDEADADPARLLSKLKTEPLT